MMVPFEEGATYPPLSLYVKALKSRPLINSMRGPFRETNVASLIAQYTGTPTGEEKVVGITTHPVNENNYFSYDAVTQTKYFYQNIDVILEIDCLNGALEKVRDIALVAVVFSSQKKPLTQSNRKYISGTDSSAFILGEILLQDIVVAHSVPMETTYFVLDETAEGYGNKDDVWPGPLVKSKDGGYRAPARGKVPPPSCVLKSCANYKIKDLRFLDPNSASYFHNFFLGATSSKYTPGPEEGTVSDSTHNPLDASLPAPRPSQYFGTPEFSRQAGGTAALFFGFDFVKYLYDNLQFASLINNNSSLLACGGIQRIRVYRQRRQQNLSSPLTAAPYGPCDRCSPTLVEVLAGPSLYEPSHEGVLAIVVSDRTIASEPEGVYGYRIEIDIVDNSRRAVEEIVKKISSSLRKYENFLTKFNEYSNKSLDNYSYVRGNIETLVQHSNHTRLINLVLGSLSFFGVVPASQLASLKNNLLSLASPYSATVETMYLFKGLMADYLNTLNNIVSENVQNAAPVLNINSKISSAPKDILSSLAYDLPVGYSHKGRDVGFDYFGSTYTLESAVQGKSACDMPGNVSGLSPCDMPGNVSGLSAGPNWEDGGSGLVDSSSGAVTGDPALYSLGIDIPNNDGMAFLQVSHDAFVDRLNIEQGKYRVANLNSMALNKFGFLSPLVLRTPQDSINVATDLGFASSLSILEANEVETSPVKDFGGTIQNQTNLDYFRSNLLAQEGISVKPKRISVAEIAATTPNQTLNYIDSALYFSTGSLFINNDDIDVQKTSGSIAPLISQAVNEERKLLNLPAINYLLQQKAQQYNEKIKISRPDLIKGSFAYNQLSTNPDPLSGLNVFQKNVDWNSFVVIEYMSNFTGRDSEWSVLTKFHFRRSRRLGQSLFCRLRRLPSIFNVPNSFELPIYNHFFILGDSHPWRLAPGRVITDSSKAQKYVEQYGRLVSEARDLNASFIEEMKGIYSELLSSPSTVLSPRRSPTKTRRPGARAQGSPQRSRIRSGPTRMPRGGRGSSQGGSY